MQSFLIVEHFWQRAAAVTMDWEDLIRNSSVMYRGTAYSVIARNGGAGGDGEEAYEGDEGGKGLHCGW